MTREERLARYERVMRDTSTLRADGHFIVRVWDGMDGTWYDCTAPVPLEQALDAWEHDTANGTRHTRYEHIDYYRIFPANTHMLYSGDHEMFR